MSMGMHFLRLTDDGTTRTAYISNNGKDYALVFAEATNTFLTPTQYGLGTFNNSLGGALTAKGSVYHLKITPGILGDAP
jgi:myo-inositol-hexaphosphate 3-phosphohydrolase